MAQRKQSKPVQPAIHIEEWPVSRLRPYERNPRKNDKAVEQMRASIREYGFAVPCLAKSDGELIDGHLRLKAAIAEGYETVPVIPCDGWTDAQVKAFRLMVNRSVAWASWDVELLAAEFVALKDVGFDLKMTGFDVREIDVFTLQPNGKEDDIPPVPEAPTSRAGDLWLCGPHRVLCGSCTDAANVERLLAGAKPKLMVTDPPYGISLDSEWRDRAGLNGGHMGARTEVSKEGARRDPKGKAEPSYMKHRTEGHGETTISGDTVADWSHAFELVPSVEVAYVWHASIYTREVLNGLERIGFLYPQQIIWDKGRTVLTRTHYWYQHEPCWYVRKKNAAWIGKAGENSTVWDAASPKFIFGRTGSEEKFDHPTQKPAVLMKKSILNHTKPGELVYEPFLGSGTTLAAAETTERVCYGMELDPKFVDVIVARWEGLSGKKATLEGSGGLTFEQVKFGRRLEQEDAIKEELEGMASATPQGAHVEPDGTSA